MSGLGQANDIVTVTTQGRGLYEFTSRVEDWIGATGIKNGLLTVFIQHTSASLLIQENADPSVQTDLATYFARIAPEDPGRYDHASEGPDDMPAHLRAALTQTHLSIPVMSGRSGLGQWQGIYLFEHRSRPHRRDIALHILGE
jgi:secondary thiamine-phosphate synthase enzyme